MNAQVKSAQYADPRWRLENLYRITDKNGKAVDFRPNGPQTQFLDEIHSRNIILKARQLGFTTLCCLIYLDACLWQENTRAAVIAHRLDDAKVIFRDKIKFPFEELPEGIRGKLEAKQDSVDTLTLANNSSIRVSTSTRSGTMQYLHISEYGKICAQWPDKAREIKTGALETVGAGGFVVIESTAEGEGGDFYEKTQAAQDLRIAGKTPGDMEYKFHFFPWYQDPLYATNSDIVIGDDYLKYFDSLEIEGIILSDAQRAWYVAKDNDLGGDMKREYPATPREAFEQAIEGAYFARELAIAVKQRRIGGYPFQRGYPVNTFWDLGRNDLNTIWLHQYVKGRHRFIGYYENSGEFIGHYVKWLKDWADENDATYGDHFLPHDGKRESLWLENGTFGVMDSLRFRPEIVPRPTDKVEAISAAREIFPRCVFDEVGCATGLNRLRKYRKAFDDQRGVWRNNPHHDINSHGADAFQTFAAADLIETEITVNQKKVKYRGSADDDSSESWMTA